MSRTKKLFEFEPMLGPCEDYPAGSPEWAERISNRLQLATQSVTRDSVHRLRSCLVQIWKAPTPPWDVWPEPPFRTPDDYCRAVTGHGWDALVATVEEMTGEQLEGLTAQRMRADLARAQVEHRGQGTRTDRHHADGMRLKQGSNNSAYLLRRLARDHQPILAAYEAGDYPSVRAAAIAAGIIKPPTPFERVLKDWPKLTEAERAHVRAIPS